MTTATRTHPWVILATDRHRCGQPVRALTEDCKHLMAETPYSRFVRFRTEEGAREWLDKMRLKLAVISGDYTYTITTL